MWDVDPNEGLSGTPGKHKTDLFIEVGSQSPQSAKNPQKENNLNPRNSRAWPEQHKGGYTETLTEPKWRPRLLYIYTHRR